MANINMDSHTKELVELSEDYLTLYNRMYLYEYLTKSAVDYDTSELPDAEMYKDRTDSFSNYFHRLKSLDMKNFKSQLSIFSDRLKKIILKKFEVIDEIAKKHDIDNLDDLYDKIMKLWNEGHINNDDFKRNIVLLVSSYYDKTGLEKMAYKSFAQIYLDMANEDMLDPMQPVGSSLEQLYLMMPIAPEFYDANFKVLSHPIDWQLYCNGSNSFRRLCLNRKSPDIQYHYNVIINALKGDCCVFDNMFKMHRSSVEKTEIETSYEAIVRTNGIDDFINDFKDILSDPEIFNHQLELYRGHENPQGDANIEEVKRYIAQKRLVMVLGKIRDKKSE